MNVTTIGETDDFPAFYSRVSGFKASWIWMDSLLGLDRMMQLGKMVGVII